jgi:hypothetical protein
LHLARTLEPRVVSAGRATDTRIISEDPLNMGFGAAASAVAHVMKYSNPTGLPTTFNVMIKFALSGAPADHVDSSAGHSL